MDSQTENINEFTYIIYLFLYRVLNVITKTYKFKIFIKSSSKQITHWR